MQQKYLYLLLLTIMAPSAVTNGHQNGDVVQKANGIEHSKATAGGYVKKTPQQKADITYQRAIDTIKEKLPKMAPLKALLEIDMGGRDGPLYLDARSEPKLVSAAEGEPDCQLKIKPEYVLDFAAGKLEPRYGLFKGIVRLV